MRILAAAIALLAVGCASEPMPDCGGSYHAHRTLTPEARVRAEAAFATWRGLATRDVVHFVDGDPDNATCSVRIDEGGTALGRFSHEDASIAIAPERIRTEAPGCASRMGDCIEAVVLHEAGHALGLEHVEGTGHVMSTEGDLLLDFTDADRAECERVGVCRASPQIQ